MRLTIVVPATGPLAETARNETIQELSSLCGGCTIYKADGCWISPTGMVEEPVIVCESYIAASHAITRDMIGRELYAIVQNLHTLLHQEEVIMYTIDNDVYFHEHTD